MYEKFYNLKQNPFRISPDPQFICMTPQHREALSGLIYSICTRPGLTLLIGEVGTGKTTLLYTLLDLLEKRRYVTAMCTNPRLNQDEFYDYLLNKLEVPCTSPLKSQQLIALQNTLLKYRAAGRMTVLIVDEAQRLHPDLMEEIRLLMNLETPREKLLQVIMAGQPELSEILRRSELRQLKQRINYFCTLRALNVEELREYLDHRLSCAGLPKQNLFAADAIEAIYEYSKGIPRVVNTLCDNALQNGFARQSPQITGSMIEEAAADLDLLPLAPLRLPEDHAEDHRLSPPAPASPRKLDAPGPVLVPGFARDNQSTDPGRVPLETYGSRQKSLGFLANLLDRWK